MHLLECRGVGMTFGGAAALSDVGVTAEAGAITGLIGPNGAGKTTLFNCITGLLQPTSGEILLDGRDISSLPPYKRSRAGVARTFQRLELFTSLTVRDNIRVAGEIRNRWSKTRVDPRAETDHVVQLLGLSALADRDVSEIPTGMARRVEMGRALMTRPKILLLDEPASGQDEQETEEFGELLLHLCAEGTAILLVEHDVSLVMKVCSFIQVLDFGRIIASGAPGDIQSNQAVLEAYLGEDHRA
ncbi:MAG: ATP-binding cassette domain-containing protein [Actinobacteria bacterium]|nr:ATP-binding cassette domain-containing protein [Actinomycetota bacterium]